MTDKLPATLSPALSPAQQNQVINIVRRAAKAEILPRFRGLASSDVTAKTHPNDLVTAADTAAEAMMTRALSIAFPTALVIGEEAVADDPSLLAKIADAPLAFVLDPIDGTWNYAHGLTLFGVIIAVTQFGRPVFGLIYDPVMDDWAIADDQSPARMDRPFSPPQPLHVSMGKAIGDLTGYIPMHAFKGSHKTKLAAALPQFNRTNSLLCAAHEYRMIAQGHADFLLTESLHPWDHAAGVLICERAGAYAEMLDGGEYSAARHEGHLLVAPDKTTWNRLRKIFGFLLEDGE